MLHGRLRVTRGRSEPHLDSPTLDGPVAQRQSRGLFKPLGVCAVAPSVGQRAKSTQLSSVTQIQQYGAVATNGHLVLDESA
jgi:hypothetical protein